MNQNKIDEEIEQSWTKNVNKFNNFINWNALRLNKRRIKEIALILGGQRLAAILRNYT